MDQHGTDYNNIVRVNTAVIVSCRAVLCWASTLLGQQGCKLVTILPILAIEIFIWRLMLAIVTQTVNTVHVQNSSRIVYSLDFFP